MSETLPAVVSFHGHELVTVQVNEVPHVAMRPLVEAIGLDWRGQHDKLTSRPDKWSVVMIPTVASDGFRREMVCLPLRKLNGWLFSIDAERVSPELREKVVMYQDECFEVLHDYWAGRRRQFSPDLQNRLWYRMQPVLTTQQLAAALRSNMDQVRGRARWNASYFRAGHEYHVVAQHEIQDLREQAAAVFACPISPFATELTVWTKDGARAMAMCLGGKGRSALYGQLERTYFAERAAGHRPGSSLPDALASAERMLVEIKGQIAGLAQVRGLLTV